MISSRKGVLSILNLSRLLASPKSISTWLAFSLLFWGAGFLLQWPIRESRIQRWQAQLADAAKNDFEDDRLKSGWESQTELDSVLDRVSKGLLVWNSDFSPEGGLRL